MTRTSRGTLLLMAGLQAGCHRYDELAEASVLRGDLLATSPAEGAQVLSGQASVQLAVGNTPRRSAPRAVIHTPSQDLELSCVPDTTGAFASCGSLDDLPAYDTDYSIEIDPGNGRRRWVQFRRGLPEGGRAFALTEDTQVTRLGSGDATVDTVDGLLAESTLAGVLTESTLSETGWVFLIGPASPSGPLLVAKDLPFAAPVTVEGDAFHSDPMHAFLPIGGGAFATSVTVRGTLRDSAIHDFTLRALLPVVSLVAMTEDLGAAAEPVLDRLELDHDLDGDGVMDAISFIVEGNPPEAPLSAWTDVQLPRMRPFDGPADH